MNETTKKTTIKRLRSIVRSLAMIVVLGGARFLLGKRHRMNHRRLDWVIFSTIIIHWCSVRVLLRLKNPYSVGDRIPYKNIDGEDLYWSVCRIEGDVIYSGSDSGGYSMVNWRTLLINELLHEYRQSNKWGIEDINELLRLETIM